MNGMICIDPLILGQNGTKVLDKIGYLQI